jgi:hypothetical protein
MSPGGLLSAGTGATLLCDGDGTGEAGDVLPDGAATDPEAAGGGAADVPLPLHAARAARSRAAIGVPRVTVEGCARFTRSRSQAVDETTMRALGSLQASLPTVLTGHGEEPWSWDCHGRCLAGGTGAGVASSDHDDHTVGGTKAARVAGAALNITGGGMTVSIVPPT